MNPCSRAVSISGHHDLAQGSEAARTNDLRDRQAARSQRIANVDKRTGQIVDCVQSSKRNDEIKIRSGDWLLLVKLRHSLDLA